MNLISKQTVQGLLKRYQAQPLKRFGQNFLIDKSVLKKIIKAADLSPKDVILEIGPGTGNLTKELAKRVKKVIAIEKDPRMIGILKETLKNNQNIKIIQGDILKYEIGSTKKRKHKTVFRSSNLQTSDFRLQTFYKVVANLPYYIVSPVIRKFLECNEVRPRYIVLMVQKEVAQRICASPLTKNLVGGRPPKMNLLAVSVQFYAEPKIISYVSKKSFWPPPKVDSAILKIIPKKPLSRFDINNFFKIVKFGFSQPRKQLLNNFAQKLNLDKEKVKNWLLENGVQPTQRAETLKIEDWIKLNKSFKID